MEFKNSGHAVVEKQSTATDRIVRVLLKKCWTENRVNLFDISVMGSVVSDITVIDPRTTNVLVSRPVTGTSTEGYQFATTSTYEAALNKALLEFVRTFSRDPQILQALNTTKS